MDLVTRNFDFLDRESSCLCDDSLQDLMFCSHRQNACSLLLSNLTIYVLYCKTFRALTKGFFASNFLTTNESYSFFPCSVLAAWR